MGTDWIINRNRVPKLRLLIVIVIVLLVLFHHLFVWPWPVGEATVPNFYYEIAEQNENYAILDLPLWYYPRERYQLFYATVHNQPIVGGIITLNVHLS